MDHLKTETITRENITIYKVENFFCNCLVEGTVVPAALMAAFFSLDGGYAWLKQVDLCSPVYQLSEPFFPIRLNQPVRSYIVLSTFCPFRIIFGLWFETRAKLELPFFTLCHIRHISIEIREYPSLNSP